MKSTSSIQRLIADAGAGLTVFLVSIPLCMGVAEASDASVYTGLIAGVVGGVVVGLLSSSSLSVSGPSAGLAALVVSLLAKLQSFENLLPAVVLAGLLQVVFGLLRLGSAAAFFPSSAVKGLIAAVGLILMLKQIPHVLGHDPDTEGEMSFFQPDNKNTFTEIFSILDDFHPGAAFVGVFSLSLLLFWNRVGWLRKFPIPAPVCVAALGIGINAVFTAVGSSWTIEETHRVNLPLVVTGGAWSWFSGKPVWSALQNPDVYWAALLIALVASLETLVNIEALGKIDPVQRRSSPNRELLAQGAGNIVCGLTGGLPISSVLERGAVNLAAGAMSKRSTVFHGFLIFGCVSLMPRWINQIPLAVFGALLVATGASLAKVRLFRQMWREGINQFIPFSVTVGVTLFTDLSTGILLGLFTSIAFILRSNFLQPIHRVLEKHLSGDVLRIQLPTQVTVFNRATLEKLLWEMPRGGHVLLDARNTDYIDPDVQDLLEDFQRSAAAAHGVRLSKVGFKKGYGKIEDDIQYVDYTSRELQSALTPVTVLEILKAGHERFRTGQRIDRDFGRQVSATAGGQFPMAVILTCIDSRSPAELIFDLGLGDIFSVRIAGNIARDKVLGSMEYSCAVAGAKLLVVMGHSSCGAVHAAVSFAASGESVSKSTGCVTLETLLTEIQKTIPPEELPQIIHWRPEQKSEFSDTIAKRNVLRTISGIRRNSSTLDTLVRDGKLAIVGAFYDVKTGHVRFYKTADSYPTPLELADLEVELQQESTPVHPAPVPRAVLQTLQDPSV
jgi:MFS superfamily sulfate permease-like transporter/carbonic anhydrase